MSLTRRGKLLALVLRHKVSDVSINHDSNGWFNIDDILMFCKITKEELMNIISSDDKGRFEVSEDFNLVRALYGHTLDVHIDYQICKPSNDNIIKLYHGSPSKNHDSIMTDGILPMDRNFVHLCSDINIAKSNAFRYSNSICLYELEFDGSSDELDLYCASNGIYVTKKVFPTSIKRVF